MLPPQSHENMGKKTLVLDLDETLVHAVDKPVAQTSFSISIPYENQSYKIYIVARPFLVDFLREMKKLYEIVVFTASVSDYACHIINIFNKKEKLIDHCLYREHCTIQSNNSIIKDISLLGRDLSKTIIIDNAETNFSKQPNNGIAIKSFFFDMEDCELPKNMSFLKYMSHPTVVVKNLTQQRMEFDQSVMTIIKNSFVRKIRSKLYHFLKNASTADCQAQKQTLKPQYSQTERQLRRIFINKKQISATKQKLDIFYIVKNKSRKIKKLTKVEA